MVDFKATLKANAQQVSNQSSVDLKEASSIAAETQVWPKGMYRARVVEVVEFGVQDGRVWEGKKKAPAEEIRLGWMLFPNAIVKKQFGNDVGPLLVRTWPFSIYSSSKANSKILFDKMNNGGDAKHFREFIGDAFRVGLDVAKNKDGKEFNKIGVTASVLPAINEETGEPLDVPEAPESAYVLFTFTNPIPEMWDKLHIEGKRDDGTSKNFIQEKIMSAKNYPGSDVERLVKSREGKAVPSVKDVQSAKPTKPAKAAKPVETVVPDEDFEDLQDIPTDWDA